MERPKSSSEPESFKETQRAFRDSCFKRGNAHMGGVDLVLKSLLDETTTREDRCQQFALTNSVRCGPVSKDSKSYSTPTMMHNCQNHTGEIIDELRPDIIVTQGVGFPRRQITNLYKPNPVYKTENEGQRQQKRSAEVCQGNDIIFLLTAHPANHPEFAWKQGPLPCYLHKAVRKVRDLY